MPFRNETSAASAGRQANAAANAEGGLWPAGRRYGKPPLIIGHRGASALEPENSLAAFDRARADGADGVELDVLLCATGEVVVFHDDDLARLGGRRERIADLSLSALRTVRLLSGATIPTLDETLEACGDALRINVELKAHGLGTRAIVALVNAVAATVERRRAERGLAERLLISSFSPGAVRAWTRRAPHIRAGLLFEEGAALPLRRAWSLPFLRVFSVHPERVLCTPAAVARWHRRGYAVHVWTVDAAAELRRLAEIGVDGVITNDPAASRRALRGGASP